MLTENEVDKATKAMDAVMSYLQIPFDPSEVKPISGTKLVDIESQAVLHRLNTAFGPVGLGWTIKGEWTLMPAAAKTRDGQTEYQGVMFIGELKYRVPHSNEWSEPIPAIGGDIDKNAGRNLYDMYKGALTNAVGQAASKLGVGGEVYRNLVTADKGELKFNLIDQEIIERFKVFLGAPLIEELSKFYQIPHMSEKLVRAFGAVVKAEREKSDAAVAALQAELAKYTEQDSSKE